MNPALLSLKPTIGNQRTLIIACNEYNMEQEQTAGIYFYTTLGNMLHRSDPHQHDIIRHHIEGNGCTQIILCGHLHCGVLKRLMQDNTSRSTLTALQFNLVKLLGESDKKFFQGKAFAQILAELNIIQQCNLLMNYGFIRERVATRNLKITGVMITPHGVNQIYSDGFFYNNLISLN